MQLAVFAILLGAAKSLKTSTQESGALSSPPPLTPLITDFDYEEDEHDLPSWFSGESHHGNSNPWESPIDLDSPPPPSDSSSVSPNSFTLVSPEFSDDHDQCKSFDDLLDSCKYQAVDGAAKVLFGGTCVAAGVGFGHGMSISTRIMDYYDDSVMSAFKIPCPLHVLTNFFAGGAFGVAGATSFCMLETARICTGVPLTSIVDDIERLSSNVEDSES